MSIGVDPGDELPEWLTLHEACAVSRTGYRQLRHAVIMEKVTTSYATSSGRQRIAPSVWLYADLDADTNELVYMPPPPLFPWRYPDVRFRTADLLFLLRVQQVTELLLRRHTERDFGDVSARPPGQPSSPGNNKPARPWRQTTKTAGIALPLYLHEYTLNASITRNELARQVVDFARTAGLEGADALDDEGSVMRELAACVLQARRRSRSSARYNKPARSSRQQYLNRAIKTASVALGLYMLEHTPLDADITDDELARRAIDSAMTAGLEGADALDGDGGVMRELAASVLQVLQARRRRH